MCHYPSNTAYLTVIRSCSQTDGRRLVIYQRRMESRVCRGDHSKRPGDTATSAARIAASLRVSAMAALYDTRDLSTPLGRGIDRAVFHPDHAWC
jgi:hypothetical protein